MATKVGIGFSERADSRGAGVEAARAAMQVAGGSCRVVLLFSTSKHDPVALRDGVRSIVGPAARLAGGYAVGVITNDQLGYDGFQVGVAAIASDEIEVELLAEGGLAGNERAVGARLGRRLDALGLPDDAALLLLYDSVNRTSGRLKLNMATPLLEGMGEALGRWPATVGLGMVGDMQCRPTYQWFDDRIEQQSTIAVALAGGGVRMDTLILHGCHPASDYHTVTKTDGNVVLEIDGRLALDVIADLLGPESGKSWRDYSFFVTLGVNKGDKYGEFREEDYANRLCLGVDKERGGLVMFEPDLMPGSEVQLMRRSLDFEYVARRCEELLERVQGRTPLFAFYIDCAGRAAAYCGRDDEEAWEVQRVIGERMPLLGVYSGVEVAPVAGQMQALDWTGVLSILSV